jgi:hypothetical protein
MDIAKLEGEFKDLINELTAKNLKLEAELKSLQ